MEQHKATVEGHVAELASAVEAHKVSVEGHESAHDEISSTNLELNGQIEALKESEAKVTEERTKVATELLEATQRIEKMDEAAKHEASLKLMGELVLHLHPEPLPHPSPFTLHPLTPTPPIDPALSPMCPTSSSPHPTPLPPCDPR